MELSWSLKELYSSFDSDAFKADIVKLQNTILEINIWADNVIKCDKHITKKLEEYIEKFTFLNNLATKIGSFIELSLSTNTKDTEALKYSDIFENELTNIVEATTKLEKWISSI